MWCRPQRHDSSDANGIPLDPLVTIAHICSTSTAIGTYICGVRTLNVPLARHRWCWCWCWRRNPSASRSSCRNPSAPARWSVQRPLRCDDTASLVERREPRGRATRTHLTAWVQDESHHRRGRMPRRADRWRPQRAWLRRRRFMRKARCRARMIRCAGCIRSCGRCRCANGAAARCSVLGVGWRPMC